MHWAQFEAEAPEFAQAARERMEPLGLVLVGTIRKDGTPRISPVEPLITGGKLYLGMMWRSRKAVDLLRDQRVLVHTIITNRDGTEGEVKIRGVAIDVQDPDERERYGQALYEAIDWRPEGDEFHLFAVDIHDCAVIRFENEEKKVMRWEMGKGK